jgi:hypothetical protein
MLIPIQRVRQAGTLAWSIAFSIPAQRATFRRQSVLSAIPKRHGKPRPSEHVGPEIPSADRSSGALQQMHIRTPPSTEERDHDKKLRRVRILMTPRLGDADDDRVHAYSGPTTVLTGLPRTIIRHELRLIVPLADSTIFEMETRRIPAPLQPLATLCGLGPGRGRGLA